MSLTSCEWLDEPPSDVEACCMKKEPSPSKRVNVRRAEIMEMVEKEITGHYQSDLVDAIRRQDGVLTLEKTQFILAREFGFCNGVRRAIDIAYAARRVFPNERLFLIGEIIHNPEVNSQLDSMGVIRLPWKKISEEYRGLGSGDVVIVPAFGVPLEFMAALEEQGVSIVDTTCGDVMKVWKRVKSYSENGITSIIHGKSTHEETRATASRALGHEGKGKYLIIYTLDDARRLADCITGKISPDEFMKSIQCLHSEGFDAGKDLASIGLANQTTMLKSETKQIQEMLKAAVLERDGNTDRFHVFDTICGATQDRQDALFKLLERKVDMMFVVGGYNSSNTTHLVEIAKEYVPSYFIEQAAFIQDLSKIRTFDTDEKKEKIVDAIPELADMNRLLKVGITAGASCPGNLIEDTIRHIAGLRGDLIPPLEELR